MSLPRIFLLSLLLLVAGCGDAHGPAQRLPLADAVRVVAGTGEIAAETVERVRNAVAAELPPLARLFPGTPSRPLFVHVHGSRDELPPALAAHLLADSPAFAMLGSDQIHIVWGELARAGSTVRGVVVHELAHVLLDQFVSPNGREMPRWFHEGLAQHLAGDTYLGAREEELVWKLFARRLEPFRGLHDAFPREREEVRTAYAQSYSYVNWLVEQYGLDALLAVARAADHVTSFDRALVGRTGRSTLELEEQWRDHLLYRSGAFWRELFEKSFWFLLIAALPLLVLAVARRLDAEARARRALRDGGDVGVEPDRGGAIGVDAEPASDDPESAEGPGHPERTADASTHDPSPLDATAPPDRLRPPPA